MKRLALHLRQLRRRFAPPAEYDLDARAWRRFDEQEAAAIGRDVERLTVFVVVVAARVEQHARRAGRICLASIDVRDDDRTRGASRMGRV